jgi:hypothetical protein
MAPNGNRPPLPGRRRESLTHPEELLAGYVDGTLSAQERAVVETHVSGCSKCSREIAMASSARSALEASTTPAPEDIGSLAIQEASGHRGHPASAGPLAGIARWLVAAVAAGLLVFTLVLARIGQSDDAGGGDQRELSTAAGDTEAGKLSGLGHRDLARELRQHLADRVDLVVGGRRPAVDRWRRRAPDPLATGQAQVTRRRRHPVLAAAGPSGLERQPARPVRNARLSGRLHGRTGCGTTR